MPALLVCFLFRWATKDILQKNRRREAGGIHTHTPPSPSDSNDGAAGERKALSTDFNQKGALLGLNHLEAFKTRLSRLPWWSTG